MIPIISKVDFYLWTEKRKCKVRVNRMLGAGTTQLCKHLYKKKKIETKPKIQEWEIKGK